MAISTYTELVNSLTNWLDRSDLASFLPDFIALTEARFHRDLRIRPMQATASDTTTQSVATLALPTGFIEMRSLYIDGDPKTPLPYVSSFHKDGTYGGSQTAKPKMFTIVGSNIVFAPTPDSAYTVYVDYWKTFDALTTSNATNWMITNAPDVYLFGALAEAAPFIKDDARAVYWATRYQSAIESLQTSHADTGSTGMAIRAAVNY